VHVLRLLALRVLYALSLAVLLAATAAAGARTLQWMLQAQRRQLAESKSSSATHCAATAQQPQP
jgi:hypothetical protein